MRPKTTLFNLVSLDGKISTGSSDIMDFDDDIPHIFGDPSAGLHQYYEVEQTTELWALVSGRTMAKLGANTKPLEKNEPVVSFVVVDNQHLTPDGIRYMSSRAKQLILITFNKDFKRFNGIDNIHVISDVGLAKAFDILYTQYGCEALTVQSGGTLSSSLIQAGLIDYVDIVIAPILVGGSETPTFMDGKSLSKMEQKLAINKYIKSVRFKSFSLLDNSYIRLTYQVNN